MPVDPRLAQYVQAELAKGFSKDQIRLALGNSGYAARDIDTAFSELATDTSGAGMLTQSLARSGVPQEQVRDQLVKAGYAGSTATRAIKDVYGVAPATSGGAGKMAVFAIIALLVGAGGMWLLLGDAPDTPVIQPTGPVSFSPAEVIASMLETARTQGSDAGVSACRERLSGRDRDLCILDVAILPGVGSLALCDQVADVTYADACYLNFVGDGSNVDAICAKVRLAENRDTCETITRLGAVQDAV